MPNLGSQFNNTYFISEQKGAPTERTDAWWDHYGQRMEHHSDTMASRGIDVTATNEQEAIRNKASKDADHKFPQTGEVTQEFRHPYQKGHLQGMLFPPHTGMMTSDDPTYPQEKRRSDISKALNTSSKLAVSYAENSDMPTHVMSPSVAGLSDPNKINATTMTSSSVKAGRYELGAHKIQLSANNDAHDTGAGSFVHEMGHKEDFDVIKEKTGKRGINAKSLEVAASERGSGRTRTVISPVLEGAADAYSDRYAEQPGWDSGTPKRHEATLDPAQNSGRFNDLWMENSKGGYHADFRGWKDKHEMALYAATRLHVATGGKSALESLPDMDALAKTHLGGLADEIHEKKSAALMKSNKGGFINPRQEQPEYQTAARHLYLGQLVHENPAIHGQLEQMGLGDVSSYSQSFYKHHVANTPVRVREAKTEALDKVDRLSHTSHYTGVKNIEVDGQHLPIKGIGVQNTLPGMEQYDELTVNAAANPMPKPLSKKQLTRDDPAYGRQQKQKEQAKERRASEKNLDPFQKMFKF